MSNRTKSTAEYPVLQAIPTLRARAIALTESREDGDALVEAVLAEALARVEEYRAGASVEEWLLEILESRYRQSMETGIPGSGD